MVPQEKSSSCWKRRGSRSQSWSQPLWMACKSAGNQAALGWAVPLLPAPWPAPGLREAQPSLERPELPGTQCQMHRGLGSCQDIPLLPGRVSHLEQLEHSCAEVLLSSPTLTCPSHRSSSTSAEEPTSHRGGGSGGYLEHVFRHAARELFGVHVDEVIYRPLRSVGWDSHEASRLVPPQPWFLLLRWVWW